MTHAQVSYFAYLMILCSFTPRFETVPRKVGGL